MTETTSTAVAAPQAPGAILSKPLSIRDTVLAQFKDTEAGLQAMADKYRNVVYDVTTTKGMNEAKAARAELRDDGRLAITRAEKKVKADVAELKEVMGTEVERLVAIVKPVEESIDAQIKVEEKRKLDEKADRERKEAERVDAHRTNIEQLRAYVAQAEGQPLEIINGAIEKLLEMTFGQEWEEFAQQAQAERDNTVAGLRNLVQREQQRIENENLRAELAALKANAAPPPASSAEPEPALTQQAPKAIGFIADSAADAPFEVDDWGAMEALQEAPAPAHAPIAAPAPPASSEKAYARGGWSRAAATPSAATPTEASARDDGTRVSLSQLKERIAPLSIDAAGLETLGFKHVSAGGTSKLYRACDLPAIRDAMVKHLHSINF
ncbi:hypothetical protein KW843_22925 [Acidovorax sp. sif1233]|uniref:hypothetical protein n=1 Tax=Acidovorax sp. sif1233 TaxID=2854792 RepID=UPI001C464654|nr:hypothetical protein [Acidovorax sp. sif1233]MBV7457352.1 hypothetical protein [Acidovorax sp. sif1233]